MSSDCQQLADVCLAECGLLLAVLGTGASFAGIADPSRDHFKGAGAWHRSGAACCKKLAPLFIAEGLTLLPFFTKGFDWVVTTWS
jgi:hypothetical protein